MTSTPADFLQQQARIIRLAREIAPHLGVLVDSLHGPEILRIRIYDYATGKATAASPATVHTSIIAAMSDNILKSLLKLWCKRDLAPKTGDGAQAA